MKPSSRNFVHRARLALGDQHLRSSMHTLSTDFLQVRLDAIARLPEFEDLRKRAKEIRNQALENLDVYLEKFEHQVQRNGGKVHWCSTAADANAAVLDICRQRDAKLVTKAKSMITEEIGLNDFLEEHGVEPVETDVGEHILQLAGEPPSHIVGPAMHKTKDQVSDLFFEHHRRYGKSERLTSSVDLVAQARDVIRDKYFDADVGITGANFLIAETGTVVVVTNECNADLSMTLPGAHVVVTSIDRVVPTLDDASTLLRLLARSVSGQELTVYTTFVSGPRASDDPDGPEEFHVVLYDGGRSRILGTPAREVLRCIRCSACMNHCPVYHAAGGVAYGWVYPGPIGAALNPGLIGVEEAFHLPRASTFCGRCQEVCPVDIPLPKIMHHWRERAFEEKIVPRSERLGLSTWAFFAARPRLYRWLTKWAGRFLRFLGRRRGSLRRLPFARGWTQSRDLPAPAGTTFFAEMKRRGRRNER